jgi:hypothetical protein
MLAAILETIRIFRIIGISHGTWLFEFGNVEGWNVRTFTLAFRSKDSLRTS